MKTLKNSLMIALGLSLTISSEAQVKLQPNAGSDIPYSKNEVGLEVGGNSLIYSVYYQRALYRKGNTQFNIRIGSSFIPGFDNYSDGSYTSKDHNVISYLLPNFLFFHRKHAWEVGLGLNMFANFHKETFGYYNNPQSGEYVDNQQLYFLTPQVGYRAYLKNSKFYFRAAVSTFILVHWHNTNNDMSDIEPKVLPWGAVGFGYRF